MSHSRRDFLKEAMGGTSLVWESLRMPAAPATSARDNPGEPAITPLETRLPIPLQGVRGRRTGEGNLAIHPGESVRVRALIRENSGDVAWRLRLTGEVDVDRRLRTEPGFPPFYRLIDDALDPQTTHHRSYNLALRSNGELYPRRAYFRVFWNTTAEKREYLLKVWMKTDALETLPGGRVGVEAAVYEKCPGRNRGDITGPPDKVYFLEAGDGTQEWQERRLPVPLDGNVACVLFTVVGEKFRGRIWLEDPQFPGPNYPVGLPPFAPSRPAGPYRNWVGENLSEKEWPDFRLTLNGKEFFHSKLFQPEYAWPSAEVDVPAGLPREGENDLNIQLVSDYHQALAYTLRDLEWLQIPSGALEVVACPELVEAGKEFPVTIRTRAPGLKARVEVTPAPGQQRTSIAPVRSDLVFPTAGLNFVRFRAEQGGPGGTITFHFGTKVRHASVERVVEREEDGVLVGSGDSLYVAAEPQSLERFHAWFLHHSLGNSIVYRPIYRWGGTRVLNPEAWKEAVRFCEAAGLKYSLILDGREMPGTDGNPTDEMLAGPLFMGSQLHEFDGIYDYAGIRWRWPDEELFLDLYDRLPPHGQGGRTVDPRVRGTGSMKPLNYDPNRARDMREAAEYFVENIHRQVPLARRHSGPSTLFKYFFQAGCKWLAAETMYGPHEIVLGALRGASLAYGQPRYGAHVATEWSTTPHDDPAAFRRYFLALATPYIHGTEHIYIEDGLWHMEEGFSADDRFSPACQGHLKVHQEFGRFTRAHSRRGHMRVPVGFLQGQHDGWDCWTHATVWGQTGSQWEFAEPEKSWDLLKVFFPRSVLAAIYREPCPHEPVGFFSGTPYGPADIIPIEAGLDTFSKYSTLVFLGWNTANMEQVGRLRKYVEAGGHVIMAIPHLSTETRRKELPQPLAGPQVQQLLGLKFRGLKASEGEYSAAEPVDQSLAAGLRGQTLQLGDVILDGAVARLADAAGTPVLLERKLGTGQLTFVNVASYPGDAALEALYRELLRNTGERVLAEQRVRVWGKGSEDASFTVYDWDQVPGKPATSTVYFLNVNWWSDTSQPCEAHLLWEDADIPLAITRGKIHRVTVAGNWGLWTCDTDTDVKGLNPASQGVEISLQGQGKTRLRVLYRPAAGGGPRIKLCGKSSQGPLTLEALDVPGLWQTEVILQGPEVFQISPCP